MHTKMPFNTEAERKTIRQFSWRQAIYLLFAGLIYLSIVSEVVLSGSFSFIVATLLTVFVFPVTLPFLLLAFLKHPQTGYYLDRHLIFVWKFKSSQVTIWRK